MLRQFTAVCFVLAFLLSSLSFNHSVTAHPRHDERAFVMPAPLVNHLDQWIEKTDFWRLVTRGESIQQRIEVIEKESPAVEAWVCGTNQICFTTGLRRYVTESELQAVIAHEIGHIVVTRNPDAPLQLWEIQCDLFAAALLRDADLVKSMLYSVNRACRNCSDQQHPAPLERVALLEYSAEKPMEQVRRLDELRASAFNLPLASWLESPFPKGQTP